MKPEKYILNAAALGLTIASGLAFKVHKRFLGSQLYTRSTGSCKVAVPLCFTMSEGHSISVCPVIATYYTNSFCIPGSTWFTHRQIMRSDWYITERE